MADKKSMTRSGRYFGRSIAISFAALGFAILGLAGYWLYASSGLVFTGVRSSGVVTGLTAVMDAQGRALGFAPVVKYSDESGRAFVHRTQVADNPAAYAPGDYVPVYYDPANPEKAIVRSFRETFAVPLFIAIVGSFFLLLAGITSKPPPRRTVRQQLETFREPKDRAGPDQSQRLQFHPFNAVAYKHYLSELKSTNARKVKITDAAASLPEGRCPVVLCEFLAAMAAICYAKNAEAYIAEHCPHLARPKVFKARNTQGLAFLFEDIAFIVLCPIDLDNRWRRFAIATAIRCGRHDFVPGDVIWEGAPRHTGFAKEWDGVRSEIEQWVKETALKDDPERPFIFAGHATGGALANLGAYEFAKRGRVVSGVITFAAPPPAGQAFAEEYNQLGLDDRTLRLEFDAAAQATTPLPLLYVPVGREWRLDRQVLPGRDPPLSDTAPPRTRTAYAAYSLQRRFCLTLSTLVYQRLRELTGASGTSADYDAAYNALADHLAHIRGTHSDQTGSIFPAVKVLPVKVKDAADLAALEAAFPDYLI